MRGLSFIALVVLAGLLFAKWGLFTVHETERALVVRLGRLQEVEGKARIYQPGLHIKAPILDDVLYFDTRLQMSELPSARILTVEKKDLIVDLFVKWKIEDFPLFYKSTSGAGSARDGKDRATLLLNQKVIDSLRAAFGQKTIRQVVSENRSHLMSALKTIPIKSCLGLGSAS